MDEKIGIEYNLNYVWYPDDSFEFYHLFTDLEDVGINLINDPPKPVEKEPEPVKTQAQLDDEALMARYEALESDFEEFDSSNSNIPVSAINDMLDFMRTRSFNIYELRAKVIPYCIEYKVKHKALFRYLQRKV